MYLCNISEATGSVSSATKNSKWRSNLSKLLTPYFSERLLRWQAMFLLLLLKFVFIVASSILLILWTFSVLFYSSPLLLLSFLYLYFWHYPLFIRHCFLSGWPLSSLEDNQKILWKLINLYFFCCCCFNYNFTTTYQCCKFNPEHTAFKHFSCFIYQTRENKTYRIRLWWGIMPDIRQLGL